jgi:hypothetical protein
MLILFHFVVSPWTDLAIDTLPYPKRNGHIPIQPGGN